jgi:hypothetical protein
VALCIAAVDKVGKSGVSRRDVLHTVLFGWPAAAASETATRAARPCACVVAVLDERGVASVRHVCGLLAASAPTHGRLFGLRVAALFNRSTLLYERVIRALLTCLASSSDVDAAAEGAPPAQWCRDVMLAQAWSSSEGGATGALRRSLAVLVQLLRWLHACRSEVLLLRCRVVSGALSRSR